MNKLKLWLEQTMMISFAILVGIILEGLVCRVFGGEPLSEFNLDWIQLVSVVLTGSVCSVPTVLFLTELEGSKKSVLMKIALHCVGLYAIVSLFGWLFKWFTNAAGFIMITVFFFLVYVFVWVVTLWFHKRDDNKINQALDGIRDAE